MSSIFLTTPDLIVFFGSLFLVMTIGILASRLDKTSEDFFLAGRKTPWWGVAGSIFGSNVSANHMVGMMGIGFSVGFAQAHFELGAIVGLMLLCYGLLPVFRKLKIYTLSQYLGDRYDERSRLSYSLIMITVMAITQMVPALYIGSRSVCILIGGEAVKNVVTLENLSPSKITVVEPNIKDSSLPSNNRPGYSDKLHVDPIFYSIFVIGLAIISASYTIWGGLKAVIWTDVIQSVLLLGAGILLAFLTFSQIGGWNSLIALDEAGAGKMHLYLPSNHPDLPWTGVLSGLMALHCFYWGTNQFIVQRALSARSESEARFGIITAGFLKLLIPFFAVATGVAAYYLFQTRFPDRSIPPDTAFTELVLLVVPIGTGIVGLMMAGVIGAILSSIDSMMNSAATLVAVDIYKRHFNPNASDRGMILIGRLSIIFFMALAALLAIFILDPNSEGNFFLQIVEYQSYLTPGILVAFLMGIFWYRSTPTAGFSTIIGGIFFSWLVDFLYRAYLVNQQGVTTYLGEKLNTFHRVVFVLFLCVMTHILVSYFSKQDLKKQTLIWTKLTNHSSKDLRIIVIALICSFLIFGSLGWAVSEKLLGPLLGGTLAAIWTFTLFLSSIKPAKNRENLSYFFKNLKDDRFWSGVLCSIAVFMMFAYF